MGVDNALRYLDRPDAAALRDLPHPIQCLLSGAAQGVHEYPLGLVDDRARAGRVAQLSGEPPRVVVLGHRAD